MAGNWTMKYKFRDTVKGVGWKTRLRVSGRLCYIRSCLQRFSTILGVLDCYCIIQIERNIPHGSLHPQDLREIILVKDPSFKYSHQSRGFSEAQTRGSSPRILNLGVFLLTPRMTSPRSKDGGVAVCGVVLCSHRHSSSETLLLLPD